MLKSIFIMADFKEYNLHPDIIKALDSMGYLEPSPIQALTLPLILEGKDLIGQAQTGSGKTAACAIPICHRVDITNPAIQALILVPTRELALQYVTETQKVGKYRGVKAFAVYGGEDAGIQIAKIKHAVQVLVATPGRLIDFIYSRDIDLSQVETLILDEADEMLSMGFYDDIEFIIQCLVHDHETLLFSATMPTQIQKLAKKHMRDPQKVILTTKLAAPTSISHRFLYCHHRERGDHLYKLISQSTPHQSIIFCSSRIQAEKVCKELRNGGVEEIDFLHGGLNQQIRTIVTEKFRRKKIKHLVATDVASRGLDFSSVTHVFIYELGSDPDVYLHRSGRTGRWEKEGTVISLVTRREMGILNKIMRKLNQKPTWIGKGPKH